MKGGRRGGGRTFPVDKWVLFKYLLNNQCRGR